MIKKEIHSLMNVGEDTKNNQEQVPEYMEALSSETEKEEKGTLTDQSICNCSTQIIAKLQEKAHLAFMQVIEIENLYKEELNEQKEHYEKKQKEEIQQYECEKQLLEQKCLFLEKQLEKFDGNSVKNSAIPDESFESPFTVENIESILPRMTPDDSCESIYANMNELINGENLEQTANSFLISMNNSLLDFKSDIKRELRSFNLDIDSNLQTCFTKINSQIEKIFKFIAKLIDNTLIVNQKFSDLKKGACELEARYNKVAILYESCEKQTKFMTEHIKRLSQDNLLLKKRFFDLEKNNRSLESELKEMKKVIAERGIEKLFIREIDVVSTHNIRHGSNELDISKSSMISAYARKRSTGKVLVEPNKSVPLNLNFKKKMKEKSQQKI